MVVSKGIFGKESNDGQILEWETSVLDLGAPVKLTAHIESIGPDKAEEMLDNMYGNQRRINKSVVSKIATAMYQGEYIDAIANPIFISNTGKLLDGQHRLQAIVDCGRVINFLVVRGLPEKCFVYFDQNRPRAAKDALKARDVKNPLKVAAVAKLIFQLIEGRTIVPRNEVIDRLVMDYPELEQTTRRAEEMSERSHIMTSTGSVAQFLFNKIDPVSSSAFFDMIQFGGDELKDSQHPVTRVLKKLNDAWKKGVFEGNGKAKFTQGANAGFVVYDARWLPLAWLYQAFVAFASGKALWHWRSEHHTIEQIVSLCKRHIVIRHSYRDLPIQNIIDERR
tara:strand:- start:389 stop:1399 length:1011 start_codon:yes stop_codon:yes gene_type:complete